MKKDGADKPVNGSQSLFPINACLAFGTVVVILDRENDGGDIKVAENGVDDHDLL